MKITKHITFYFLEERICYINRIIEFTNDYKYETDIFIHTNNPNLVVKSLSPYVNGSIKIICHDLSDIHPFCLAWMCRDLLYKQQNDYDIFMYIEDDILVPNTAIEYWLENHEKLIEMNYNLGFVRIEIENNIEYITDLLCEHFDCIIEGVNGKNYCVNNKNTYCAFWIYNKKEFNKFANNKVYNLDVLKISQCTYYSIREASAFGLHNPLIPWYKTTLIPLENNKLIEDCKIYHMPNNYVSDKQSGFATIQFNDAIDYENVQYIAP